MRKGEKFKHWFPKPMPRVGTVARSLITVEMILTTKSWADAMRVVHSTQHSLPKDIYQRPRKGGPRGTRRLSEITAVPFGADKFYLVLADDMVRARNRAAKSFAKATKSITHWRDKAKTERGLNMLDAARKRQQEARNVMDTIDALAARVRRQNTLNGLTQGEAEAALKVLRGPVEIPLIDRANYFPDLSPDESGYVASLSKELFDAAHADEADLREALGPEQAASLVSERPATEIEPTVQEPNTDEEDAERGWAPEGDNDEVR